MTDPNEFIETVKVDLFPDEVFVFTPRGDVIGLPVGATPVDFAYAIHSEVGDSCAGAKINGKLVSLRHKLVDGDTVEILTHARQLPRKDWLDFVVTGKARSKIRHAIRAEEKARSRDLGRELLDREFRKAGLSLPRALEGARDRRARAAPRPRLGRRPARLGGLRPDRGGLARARAPGQRRAAVPRAARGRGVRHPRGDLAARRAARAGRGRPHRDARRRAARSARGGVAGAARRSRAPRGDGPRGARARGAGVQPRRLVERVDALYAAIS